MNRIALILVILCASVWFCVPSAEDKSPEPVGTRVAQLRAAVKKCDALLVVDNDLETLVEVKDAVAIETLLRGIRIDDARSGSVCMCLGYPHIVFLRGDRTIVELSFHHGRTLGWDDGPWEGHGYLEPDSRLFLGRWLAKRGVEQPLAELQRHRRGLRVLELREERYRSILSEKTLLALKASRDRRPLAGVLESTVATSVERTRLLLRMYGAHPGTWGHLSGRDPDIHRLLQSVPQVDLVAILRDPGSDVFLLSGLAKLYFHDRRSHEPPDPALASALDAVGRRAATNPRARNRRRVMSRLPAYDREKAIAILRDVLAGTLTPRAFPGAWATDPGGHVFSGALTPEVRLPASDRVAAAWLLADLGDETSRDAIERLVVATKAAPDADIVRRALQRLAR